MRERPEDVARGCLSAALGRGESAWLAWMSFMGEIVA